MSRRHDDEFLRNIRIPGGARASTRKFSGLAAIPFSVSDGCRPRVSHCARTTRSRACYMPHLGEVSAYCPIIFESIPCARVAGMAFILLGSCCLSCAALALRSGRAAAILVLQLASSLWKQRPKTMMMMTRRQLPPADTRTTSRSATTRSNSFSIAASATATPPAPASTRALSPVRYMLKRFSRHWANRCRSTNGLSAVFRSNDKAASIASYIDAAAMTQAVLQLAGRRCNMREIVASSQRREKSGIEFSIFPTRTILTYPALNFGWLRCNSSAPCLHAGHRAS